MRIMCFQVIEKVTQKPIRNMSEIQIIGPIPDDLTKIYAVTCRILYHDGYPLVIYEKRSKYISTTPVYRLASDGASAVQMRRMKKFLGNQFDRIKELSVEDMNSKVNTIMTEAISETINRGLLGE